MDGLLRSMAVLIADPWLALIPSAVFLVTGAMLRGRPMLFVGAVWFVYCGYEYGMKYRILCSGECNIRLDLFVPHPLLQALCLYAVGATARNMLLRYRSGIS